MKAVYNQATPAVTQIVTPAKPETFDLIGLTAEQLAAVTILLGICAGNAQGIQELYNASYRALGVANDDLPDSTQLIKVNRLNMSRSIVEELLSKR